MISLIFIVVLPPNLLPQAAARNVAPSDCSGKTKYASRRRSGLGWVVRGLAATMTAFRFGAGGAANVFYLHPYFLTTVWICQAFSASIGRPALKPAAPQE
jgi:hypothetical protein